MENDDVLLRIPKTAMIRIRYKEKSIPWLINEGNKGVKVLKFQ